VTVGADGAWSVRIDAPAPIDNREIRERTSFVAHTLVDDLGAFVLAPEEAMAAGRGDCTAHAIVLTKILEERGFPARLVTGYVLDEGALRRHRWVVVQVDGRWVPVDPMFDEVPAGPRHLALAVHGASPEELAFIDDVAFAGWTQASARHAR
jgi:transglutaminase-like putative cysteine protease